MRPQRSINTTTTFWQHQQSLWKSPRGTVTRIEVFALVAIVLSFLVVLFGSCRRWSKRWIFQKGILAANALSLSLGIYCIGLMQSSGVKSEMYPVWAISLLTLFGSTDSIIASSLDYNSQIIKLIFQLCLYCGYVLLIGISTTASDLGKISIGFLCAITFIKGFHRSLGCVLLSRLREVEKLIADCVPYDRSYDIATMRDCPFVVDWPLDKANPGSKWEGPRRRDDDDFSSEEEDKAKEKISVRKKDQIITVGEEEDKEIITIDQIWDCNINSPISKVHSYKDICLSFSLSHLLQLRFFGFSCAKSAYMPSPRDFVVRGLLKDSDGTINYERVFQVVEVELAFLYDVFFTNNAFLHYYESKASTVWGFASFTSICLVGVATLTPGTRTHTSGGTIIVNATTFDLIITAVILISLALLQLLQLIRCWTSDWARVSFLCQSVRHGSGSWQMRLKERLCRINWFEDNYRWQRRLGQYSLVKSISTRENVLLKHVKRPFAGCLSLLRMAGSQYVEQVFEGMLGSNTGNPVELGTDVKKAIVDYLVRHHCVAQGPNLILRANGLNPRQFDLSLYSFNQFYRGESQMLERTWIWHIATCYMEMELSRNDMSLQAKELNVHFSVATKLSKYCAYLLVSVPQLLRQDVWITKSLYNTVAQDARQLLHGTKDKLKAMRCLQETEESKETLFSCGVSLGKRLEAGIQDVTLRWKVLADFWADNLIHIAVSDNVNVKKLSILSKESRKLIGLVVPNSVKEHFEHLAKGGEFITHLWALLYHANIDRDEARACWLDREENAPEYHHLGRMVSESSSDTSTAVDHDQGEELQGEGESTVYPQEIQALDGSKD